MVHLKLSAADLHILRAILTQTNAPDSFQRRLIFQIDCALEELSRSRRPARKTGSAGAGPR